MKKIRIIYLTVLAFFCLTLLPSAVRHALFLMGGKGLPSILTGRWDIALVNIAFFLLFLSLLRFKKRVNWRSRNIYAAFIIALFAEMYGFPLTAYFVANYLGAIEVDYRPAYAIGVSFMGVDFMLPTMMIVGGAITVFGLLLIVLGWYKVYSSLGGLVTDGIYKYSRNPQYVGMILVTFGWIIHWPTILTVLMWPVLAWTYYNLAREEEANMQAQFPGEYAKYKSETPMFI
ncbi:MAG: isoprenylcysteine carboxylmethyltransferase family protein [Candidatus Altiarchaeota archaeon]